MPIYFVSRVLHDAELRYPPIKKLAYALYISAKRLRRYFQARPIEVITDQSLKQLVSKPKNTGQLTYWAITLGEHQIIFKPGYSVKGQVMANFHA